MKSCVILDDYQDAALRFADWSRLSDRVKVSTISDYLSDQDELVARIGDADILVIMRERTPFPASLLARLPRLKLLVTSGMRNAAIDLAAARERKITVCGTGTGSSPPAEMTWALILGMARNLVPEASALRSNGRWQSSVGIDLKGRTLGIFGLGKIGTQVARVGLAFGMKVVAWSPNLTDERAAEGLVSRAPTKEALLEASDFITIHLVLSPSTKGLISERDLGLMRKTAFLVNTSRAAIVDQPALIDALQQRRIAGAGLDVYEQEPLPADHPFRQLPNVLALPHLGYVSDSNYRMFFGEAVENIEAWLSAVPIRELN